MDDLSVLFELQICRLLCTFVPAASGKQQRCGQKQQNHFPHIKTSPCITYLPALCVPAHIFPIISDLFAFFNPNFAVPPESEGCGTVRSKSASGKMRPASSARPEPGG